MAVEVWAVAWDDAHFNSGEFDTDEINRRIHRPWRYITVGILVRSDATGVTLASDLGEDDLNRGFNFIPRGMVREEWRIGPLHPKRRSSAPAGTRKRPRKQAPAPSEPSLEAPPAPQ